MDDSTRTAIQAEVLEVMAPVLNLDPAQFDPDLSLAEAGLDSLGIVETVYVVEDRFGISVKFNANDKARYSATLLTTGELLDMVVELIVEKRRDGAYGDTAAAFAVPSA